MDDFFLQFLSQLDLFKKRKGAVARIFSDADPTFRNAFPSVAITELRNALGKLKDDDLIAFLEKHDAARNVRNESLDDAINGIHNNIVFREALQDALSRSTYTPGYLARLRDWVPADIATNKDIAEHKEFIEFQNKFDERMLDKLRNKRGPQGGGGRALSVGLPLGAAAPDDTSYTVPGPAREAMAARDPAGQTAGHVMSLLGPRGGQMAQHNAAALSSLHDRYGEMKNFVQNVGQGVDPTFGLTSSALLGKPESPSLPVQLAAGLIPLPGKLPIPKGIGTRVARMARSGGEMLGGVMKRGIMGPLPDITRALKYITGADDSFGRASNEAFDILAEGARYDRLRAAGPDVLSFLAKHKPAVKYRGSVTDILYGTGEATATVMPATPGMWWDRVVHTEHADPDLIIRAAASTGDLVDGRVLVSNWSASTPGKAATEFYEIRNGQATKVRPGRPGAESDPLAEFYGEAEVHDKIKRQR